MSTDHYNHTIEAYAMRVGHVEHERNKAIKALGEEGQKRGLVEAERDELRKVVKRLLAVIDALMPGARHIAIQDYAELNNAQVDARKLIEK
jgi:hypothetical protein